MRMCMYRSRAHARSLFFVWCTHVHKSPEILEYLKRIVATHKLLEPGAKGATAGKSIVRLSTEVKEARWDGAAQRWVVQAVNNGQWSRRMLMRAGCDS